MDHLTSRILQQKYSSYKCEFCTKANASVKDKVPDVSDLHQNIGTSCNSKFKLPNLKICVSKLQKDYQNMTECMSA